MQDALVELASNARLVVAEKSGHYIQLDEPDLATEAIRQFVDAVRNPGTWLADAATS